MAEDLKRACADAARRHNTRDVVPCPVCRVSFVGYDELWEHMGGAHGCTQLRPSANVRDMPGLMAALAAAGKDAAAADVEGFFFERADDGDDVALPLDETAEATRVFAAGQEVAAIDAEDDDADWDDSDAACRCLYCPFDKAGSLEEHMESAHGFALRSSALVPLGDAHLCGDEYDRIRVVNSIRAAVAALRCPRGCGPFAASDDLVAHIKTEGHQLPSERPTGDALLVPLIPGDAFVSLVMSLGDDDDDEEENYPMVAPVLQLAHQRQQRLLAEGVQVAADNDDDDE